MTTQRTTIAAQELVPLADRMRYMRFGRLAVVALAAAVVATSLGGVAPHRGPLAAATAGYCFVSAGGELLWRVFQRRGLWLFGALVVVDATFLAYLSYATGGMASPLRYVILLHLVAVALLASYRSGLKLVVWYVLLLLVELHLPPAAKGVWPVLPGGAYARLSLFAAILAAVTLATSAMSAVNERELRRRRFDLEALATLAVDLEHAAGPVAVAQMTVASIVENFGVDHIALITFEPRTAVLAGHGLPPAPPSGAATTGSVMRQAQELRATLLPERFDPSVDPWLASLFPGMKNMIVTPLFAEGGCLGVLVLEHGTRRGSRVERRLLSILERFASHAALALRNATLLEEVQQAAATDALTAVANRRSFEEALDREVARSGRTGEPVSLVMIDLDHFKSVNDAMGHQVGDEVLREVATALRRASREMDVVARFGGEEFVVILPGCSAEEAGASADRLRAAISSDTDSAKITASAGFATLPDNAATGRGLVGAADEALYRAKRSGRDQTVGSSQTRPKTQLGIVIGQGG